MSTERLPTPIVDAFCTALYNEPCAAAADLPGYSATERSPEEAYSAAVDLARALERRNAALVEALRKIGRLTDSAPASRGADIVAALRSIAKATRDAQILNTEPPK